MVKQVIVMRKDLGMRKGKMIAQGAHGSMAVVLNNLHRLTNTHHNMWDNPLKEWVNGSFTKIVVSVDSEEELLAIAKQAEDAGLLHALIRDAGKTEFDGVPTYTCVAIGPAKMEDVDKITGNLSLL